MEHAKDAPALYYLLNFNSYSASLVTLFHFMVINNWFVTIDMYKAVLDARYIPTLFFVLFWIFVVLVLFNVVVALILEIYSSVEPEVHDQSNKLELTLQLVKIVEGVDKDDLVQTFADVRHRLTELENKLTES